MLFINAHQVLMTRGLRSHALHAELRTEELLQQFPYAQICPLIQSHLVVTFFAFLTRQLHLTSHLDMNLINLPELRPNIADHAERFHHHCLYNRIAERMLTEIFDIF